MNDLHECRDCQAPVCEHIGQKLLSADKLRSKAREFSEVFIQQVKERFFDRWLRHENPDMNGLSGWLHTWCSLFTSLASSSDALDSSIAVGMVLGSNVGPDKHAGKARYSAIPEEYFVEALDAAIAEPQKTPKIHSWIERLRAGFPEKTRSVLPKADSSVHVMNLLDQSRRRVAALGLISWHRETIHKNMERLAYSSFDEGYIRGLADADEDRLRTTSDPAADLSQLEAFEDPHTGERLYRIKKPLTE